MHESADEQPEAAGTTETADDSSSNPGLANRAFTATTLAVGFAIIVVMVFATLAPGPRPFLRSRVEVLGSTESTVTTLPDSITSLPTSAASPAKEPALEPNDDWAGALFGVEDTAFGDDDVLDALHTDCGNEDHQACDDLVSLTSETRSPYELWGLTCGDRSDLITGTCSERFGDASDPTASATPSLESVGTCFALPRSTEGSIRPLDCQKPHDAQIIASLASNDALQALDGSFYVGPEVTKSMETVCAAATTSLIADDTWGFPTDFRVGVIAPNVDSVEPLFRCFLWAPGWTLEESLIASQ